jgi:hypothetical protein
MNSQRKTDDSRDEELERTDDRDRDERQHEDDLLDEALKETFPASDPISIAKPRRKG